MSTSNPNYNDVAMSRLSKVVNMSKPKFISFLCISGLIAPLLVVCAKQPDIPNSQLIELTNEWRKHAYGQDLKLRKRAVEGFSGIGDEISSGVKILTDRLSDQDDEIRLLASKGLIKYGICAGSAAEQLVLLLEKDKVTEIRINAAAALGAIMWRGNNFTLTNLVVPALIKALRHDPDTLVRRSACVAIRNIGPKAKEAAPELLELMKQKDDAQIRELARLAFVEVSNPDLKKMTPVLTTMLKMGLDDPNVERAIIWSLGKIGEPRELIIPYIIEAVENPKRDMRGAGLAAIMEMGPAAKAAVPAVIMALDVSHLDNKHKESALIHALRTFEAIGPEAREAVPIIMKLKNSKNSSDTIRSYCDKALKSIGN